MLPSTSPSPSRRRACAGALALVAWCTALPARAEPAPDLDVWVASTRRLPAICRLPRDADLDVARLGAVQGCDRWLPATRDELFAPVARPFVVFVHGNRYDLAAARSEGLELARKMAAACPRSPARFVILAWPSEQEGRLVPSLRANYARAHTDGLYLAWLLGQVSPDRPVAVVGYSYGALMAVEALAALACAGNAADVAPWVERPGRTHLVLVAAAVQADALAPGGPYRAATRCVDRLVLVNNTRDPALRFFEYVDPRLRAEALGHEGMPASWVPRGVEFRALDAANVVGRRHAFASYLDAAGLLRQIAVGAVGGLERPE